MRPLVLAAFVLLGSHAALAQLPPRGPWSAPSWPSRAEWQERGEHFLMGTAGFAAEAVVIYVAVGSDVVPLLVATPVAAGFAVYGAGRALGRQGELGPTMLGAGLGTLPGIGLFALAATAGDGDPGQFIGDNAILALLGAMAYVTIPPMTAITGFDWSRGELQPVVLQGPDGEQTPGLALRVRL